MTNPLELSPKERLAASRKALVNYMNHEEDKDVRSSSPADDGMEGLGAEVSDSGIWSTVKHSARVWWHHHPAQLALNLAKPALSRYAEEKPLQLLGLAAAAGAATVVIRPWRLISLTGLLFAAIKASDAPVLLMSILSSRNSSNTSKKEST